MNVPDLELKALFEMPAQTSVVALAIIALALVSCSKRPTDTTQQKASGREVVTNKGGFVFTFRSVTNSTPATNSLGRGKKVVIKGNTMTQVPDP